MAQPATLAFPKAVTTAVCLGQTTAGAGNLLINGTLANQNPTTPLGVVTFPDYARTVSLTVAVTDLSGANITITGTDIYGAAVTETRAGPNNNTVFTTAIFHTVSSVSTNAALGTAMSVGSGTTGTSRWYKVNYNNNVYNTSIAGEATATINYTVNQTLDNVDLSTPTPISFAVDASLTAATGNILFTSSKPVTGYQIVINSSSTNGAVNVVYLQQGISGS
jgi:hypothetical protein